MKRQLLTACLLAAGALTGTVFAQKNQTTVIEKFQDSQARLLDVTTNAHVKPQVVEFAVLPDAELRQTAQKLNAKGEGRTFTVFGNVGRLESHLRITKEKAMVELRGELTNIRSWAVFQINQAFNSDLLVGATFDIQKPEDSEFFEVTVIGYPARFTKFSSVTPADYEWIRLENSDNSTDADKTKTVRK